MSGLKMYGTKPKRMYIGGLKAKKAYCMGERVWSAGSIVTYICNGVSYQEEVEDGNTVLSPTTFAPTLDGATFLGWSLYRDDATVQTSLFMEGEPITLYAVFKYADGAETQTYKNPTASGYDITARPVALTMPTNAEKFRWKGKCSITNNNRTDCDVYIGKFIVKSNDVYSSFTDYYSSAISVDVVFAYAQGSTITFYKEYIGKTVVG